MNTTSSVYFSEKRILKLRTIRVSGTECLALSDTGAAHSFISFLLSAKIEQDPTPTRRTINVANGVTVGGKGFIKKVPVTVFKKVVKMNFLIFDGVPVDVMIPLTDLEHSQETLGLGGQFIGFNVNKRLGGI